MRKTQLWSILREIPYAIAKWDNETFMQEIAKPEMSFAKYLPSEGDWYKTEKYIIKIKIEKESIDEKEISLGEGT